MSAYSVLFNYFKFNLIFDILQIVHDLQKGRGKEAFPSTLTAIFTGWAPVFAEVTTLPSAYLSNWLNDGKKHDVKIKRRHFNTLQLETSV